MKYTDLLNHELLDRSEERQLLLEAQSGNEMSRDRLILSNLRLVNQIALVYARSDFGVSAEDLIADGVQGLMRAIERFDVESGYKLSTYAYFAIHHAIRRSDLLNEIIRLPLGVRERQWKIQTAEKVLLASGTPAPTFQEIADVSGVSLAEVERHALLDETVIGVASLDQPVDEDEEMMLADILPTQDTDLARADIQMDLEWFLSLLPELERFILTRSSGIPVKLSTAEIARRLGRSRQWVYETRRGALKALQRLARALNGRVWETDDVCVKALHRKMKLRPVPVPEGIRFVDGEVVKKTETPPATHKAVQLYFALRCEIYPKRISSEQKKYQSI